MAHVPTPVYVGDQQLGKSDWSAPLQDMYLIFCSLSLSSDFLYFDFIIQKLGISL